MEVSLEMLEQGYATGSTVTRWRAANPQSAVTADDCIAKTIARIRKAIGPKAPQIIRGNASSVLLLFKRR
nr:hypothetical protein CFP56_63416 [Quercus suber]POE94738.1 hypothetical protein CFP56_16975 [Quercus suber]